MPVAIRGSRAVVKAVERRVAEPHSIAFSWRMHISVSTKRRWMDRRMDGRTDRHVSPLGGMDGMTQASSCPSETSACHILVTRCVHRCQGGNNFSPYL